MMIQVETIYRKWRGFGASLLTKRSRQNSSVHILYSLCVYFCLSLVLQGFPYAWRCEV
jgi:hypothetical protein